MPLCINYDRENGYIVLSDNKGVIQLFTRDLINLIKITESYKWIWSLAICNRGILVGDENGTMGLHSISTRVVHSIYGERYCYRDGFTDVIVHNLLTNQKVCFMTNKIVKNPMQRYD